MEQPNINKRPRPISDDELDRAEEMLAMLERRTLDRRKTNRAKQIGLFATLFALATALGSCGTAMATRLGWRIIGTPDDVQNLQVTVKALTEVELPAIKQELHTIRENGQSDREYIQFLVVARCLELTLREAQLARINCDAVLHRAELSGNKIINQGQGAPP